MQEELTQHIQRWKWGTKESKYQVGPMIFFQEIQLDNYFIMKLFRKYITEDEFPAFYQYHLDHYKSRSANATEEKQFTVIWEIIQDGIRIQDRHPHSEIAKRRKKKLLAFQHYLRSIDQWHHSNTIEELVRIKSKEIEELTFKLETVKKELSRLKVDYKIKINYVDRTSVFDLFLQMRELTAPESGKRVFIDPSQSTWAKMLSNHFEDDSAIPFDTALNYFRGKSQVQEAHKRFEVRSMAK
jgi:hypothetical protein